MTAPLGLLASQYQQYQRLMLAYDHSNPLALEMWDPATLDGASCLLGGLEYNLSDTSNFYQYSRVAQPVSVIGANLSANPCMGSPRVIQQYLTRNENTGALAGEVPYLNHNTLRYMLADTRITQLATNTTLATATRFDTASKTLTISETAERVFESVRLIMTFRSEWAATNAVIGVRMGIKLGAAATVDYDRTPAAQNTASRNIFDQYDVDVTDYFNLNFGTGTTQTCVASIAVASTVGANINGITFKLIVTYAFDPNLNTTRTKCHSFAIQSQITTLTTAYQEIGTDGINPAPSGQIPAWDTLLPELSKTYVQYYLDLWAHDGNGSGVTAITPSLKIDAGAAVPRATIDLTINTLLMWRDQYDMTSLGLATNATHTLNMIGDTTTTPRLTFPGGFATIIYTYDHPSTLVNNLAMYEAIVPMTMSESDANGMVNFDSSTVANFLVDGSRFVAVLDIQEPGTPTIVQSGVFSMTEIGAANNQFERRIGGAQLHRVFTPVALQGPSPIITRVDGVWTLQRGINRLTMDCYSSTAGSKATNDSCYAIINYTAGIRVDVQNGNHAINHVGHVYDSLVSAGPIDVGRDAYSARPPVLGTPFRITALMLEVWYRMGAASLTNPLMIENKQNEWDNGWSQIYHNTSLTGVAVVQSQKVTHGFLRSVNQDNLHTGKIDITQRRRIMSASELATNALFAAWSWWVTYHQHAFVVSGTCTAAGLAAPDGSVVTVFAYGATLLDPNPNAAELVTTAIVAGGAGAFTCTVPDNTRQYFAIYENGGQAGASLLGTPT